MTSIPRRQHLAGLALTALVAWAPALVQAQAAFPARQIHLINPFPPGGATDKVSRALAEEMSKVLGQPVVVENVAGAGANIGAAKVAKSAPDGYTILLCTSSLFSIIPLLYTNLPYDPNKDLAPVTAMVSYSNVLVVHPSVKARTVQDVIALAKAQPGALSFGSSGVGTTIHIAGEMFKQKAGVDMTHVPYSGAGPAAMSLIGGQTSMMFADIPSILPQIKAEKVRAIAVTAAQRDAQLPDLPTIAESGVPKFDVTVWFGLSAPAGTPKAIIARLNEAAVQASKAPNFVRQMNEASFRILATSPERMSEMMKADIESWGPVVKASGAKNN